MRVQEGVRDEEGEVRQEEIAWRVERIRLPAFLRTRPAGTVVTSVWHRWALGGVILLSAVLNVALLSDEDYANTYYAAAVRSMLLNWHNFFFVSFDPGGFVAVDKPPLGLWIQAASAKVFGFSGMSLLLPQAVAGVLSVMVLYLLVARVFGRPAGLLAALALALTPIAVVDNRNNTADSLLVLSLLLASWATMRAVDTGRVRSLVAAAAIVGIGFNIKGLEAYLVVPALCVLYLTGSEGKAPARVARLLLAGLVLFTVSFVWIAAVDLTPAGQRPYVSDSGTNSELSLALGYNGVGRLAAGVVASLPAIPLLHARIDTGIVPAASAEIGQPSLFRLAEPALASQVSWLLPMAVAGLAVILLQRRRNEWDRRAVHVAFWGTWLLTAGVFFSMARFYHLYYLIVLAPAVAALAGIGLAELWRLYRTSLVSMKDSDWRWVWLPVALIITALIQMHILAAYSAWNVWLGPLLVTGVAVACVALSGIGLQTRLATKISGSRLALAASTLGILSLSIGPLVFSTISVLNDNGAAWLPQAGPPASLAGGTAVVASASGKFARHDTSGVAWPRGDARKQLPSGLRAALPAPSPTPSRRAAAPEVGIGGAFTYAGTQTPRLPAVFLRYLRQNRGSARFLLATTTSAYASLFILSTDAPVMALGGYQGWDRILSVATLQNLIANGTIRYFFVPSNVSMNNPWQSIPVAGAGPDLDDTNKRLVVWITGHCPTVPSTAYLNVAIPAANVAGSYSWLGANRLYDCDPGR